MFIMPKVNYTKMVSCSTFKMYKHFNLNGTLFPHFCLMSLQIQTKYKLQFTNKEALFCYALLFIVLIFYSYLLLNL